MLSIYEKARESGYIATRFLQMVQEMGGLSAAKQLLSSNELQAGLVKLWELNKLDISMETLVLHERFRELFTAEEINTAKKRLRELGYSPK